MGVGVLGVALDDIFGPDQHCARGVPVTEVRVGLQKDQIAQCTSVPSQ